MHPSVSHVLGMQVMLFYWWLVEASSRSFEMRYWHEAGAEFRT